MTERSVTHGTFVIERTYPSAPERVFAAFSDPVKKCRWISGVKDLKAGGFEMDFRVGGKECTRATIPEGPFKGTSFTNETTYLDIVPDRRIVFAYSMLLGEKRISSSLATVELLPSGKGTELIFTDQGAYFEVADTLEMREAGWRKLLERVAQES